MPLRAGQEGEAHLVAHSVGVRFGDFGIAELFLIGLKLLLKPMMKLGMLIEAHRFTKIDGEPVPYEAVSLRSCSNKNVEGG